MSRTGSSTEASRQFGVWAKSVLIRHQGGIQLKSCWQTVSLVTCLNFHADDDSPEELQDVSQLLYKVQKATAALSYLDPASDKITSTNMRLGLGITGVARLWKRLMAG